LLSPLGSYLPEKWLCNTAAAVPGVEPLLSRVPWRPRIHRQNPEAIAPLGI
jgi:hypothetical protein